LIPSLNELRQKLLTSTPREKAEICLTYVTRRGRWYDVSWKGSSEKSGGVAMNIGIHFFDVLIWLFGQPERSEVHLKSPRRMAGLLELPAARVRWFLSTDSDDVPPACRAAGKFAYRSMTIDGEELEFSDGFTDLHVKVYEEILAGRGLRISDAAPAIELVHEINSADLAGESSRRRHPLSRHAAVPASIPRRRAA